MPEWLDRIRYEGFDYFYDSYAEEQRDLYKRIIEDIEEQLENTNGLASAKEGLENDLECMEENPNCAEGKLKTTFDDREGIVRSQLSSITESLEADITTINEKLELLREEYKFWKNEASREDEEMKIYDKKYYDELDR